MSIQPHRAFSPAPGGASGNLADILERVLDKGVVIAGDIVINLLDIELLTIKLRLLIASVDTAKEMGIDWWQNDPFLTGNKAVPSGNGSRGELEQRLDRIETALESLARQGESKELR
jgi:hypothetical protein